VSDSVSIRGSCYQDGFGKGVACALAKLVVGHDPYSSQLVKTGFYELEGHSKSDTYISILRAYFYRSRLEVS